MLVFFVFIYAFLVNPKEIYVENYRAKCEPSPNKCDGSLENPFGSLASSLIFVASISKELDENLTVVLQPNVYVNPYIILDEDLPGLEEYSPFENLTELLTVVIRSEDTNPAYIAFRTERLVFQIKGQLVLKNLILSGRDFSAVSFKYPCLRSNIGCCPDNSLYYIKNSICYTFNRKFAYNLPKSHAKSLIAAFSRKLNPSTSYPKLLDLINITLLYLNPVSRYQSLVYLEAASEVILKIDNLSVLFCEFVKGIIFVDSKSLQGEEPYIISNWSISNTITKGYNSFFIEDLKSNDITYFYLNTSSDSTVLINNFTVEKVQFPGLLIKVVVVGQLKLYGLQLIDIEIVLVSVSKGVSLDFSYSRIINASSSWELSSLKGLILLSSIKEVNIGFCKFEQLHTQNLHCMFFIEKVGFLNLKNNTFSEFVFRSSGIIIMVSLGIVNIQSNSFKSLDSRVGGLLIFYQTIIDVTIEDCQFVNTVGNLLFQEFTPLIYRLAILGCNIANLTSNSGVVISLIDAQLIFIRHCKFSAVFTRTKILSIYSRMYLNQWVFIESVNVFDSRTPLFLFDGKSLSVWVKNLYCYNITKAKYLLLELNSIIIFNLTNSTLKFCESIISLIFNQGKGKRSFLILENSLFYLMRGGVKIEFLKNVAYVINCTFEAYYAITTDIDIIFGLFTPIIFDRTKFLNMYLERSVCFSLHQGEIYIFDGVVFKNLAINSYGLIIVSYGYSMTIIHKTLVSNIKGSILIFMITNENDYLRVVDCHLANIEMKKTGSLFFLGTFSYATFYQLSISNVISPYVGPGLTIYSTAIAKLSYCHFDQMYGEKGAVMSIGSKGIILIQKSIFQNCKAIIGGGVLYSMEASLISFEDSYFRNISSNSWGGVFYVLVRSANLQQGTFNIKNSIFINLGAAQEGGLATIIQLKTIIIQGLNLSGSDALNCGMMMIKLSEQVILSDIYADNLRVLEKGGTFRLEYCSYFVLSKSKFIAIKNNNMGKILLLFNTNTSVHDVQIGELPSSTYDSLIFINNRIPVVSFFENIKLYNITGNALIFDITNETPNQMQGHFLNIFNISCINNFLNKFIRLSFIKGSIKNVFWMNNQMPVESNDNIVLATNSEISLVAFFILNSTIEGGIQISTSSFVNITDFTSIGSTFSYGIRLIDTNSSVISRINLITNTSLGSSLFIYLKNVNSAEINKVYCSETNLKKNPQAFRFLASYNSSLFLSQAFFYKIFTISQNFINCVLNSNVLALIDINLFRSYFTGIGISDLSGLSEITLKGWLSYEESNTIIDNKMISIKTEHVSINKINNKLRIEGLIIVKIHFYIQSMALISFSSSLIKGDPFPFRPEVPSFVIEKDPPFITNVLNSINLEGNSKVIFSNMFMTDHYHVGCFRSFLEYPSIGFIDINNCTFLNCRAQFHGGALLLIGPSSVKINESQFIGNYANTKGGAIYLRKIENNVSSTNGSLEISHNTFRDNYAFFTSNLIFLLSEDKDLVKSLPNIFLNNIFSNNTSNKMFNQYNFSGVSTQPSEYSFSIQTEKNSYSFSKNLTQAEWEDQVVEAYSGEKILLIIDFYDQYMQPNMDYLEGMLDCKLEMNLNNIYMNNTGYVINNRAILPELIVISSKRGENTSLKCMISFEENSLAVSDQSTSKLIELKPVPFMIRNCLIGQYLKENLCKYCVDSYSFVVDVNLSTRCHPCPENAKCVNGSFILPLPGYWNSDRFSKRILSCALTEACLARFNDTGDIVICDKGYTGNLCFECAYGYGMTCDRKCILCNDSQFDLRKVFLLIRIFITLTYMVIFLVLSLHGYDKIKGSRMEFLVRLNTLIEYADFFTILFKSSMNISKDFNLVYIIISTWSVLNDGSFLIDCVLNNVLDNENKLILKSFLKLLFPISYSIVIFILTLVITKYKSFPKFNKVQLFYRSISVSHYFFLLNALYTTLSAFLCASISNDGSRVYLYYPNINCNPGQDLHVTTVSIVIFIYTVISLIIIFYQNHNPIFSLLEMEFLKHQIRSKQYGALVLAFKAILITLVHLSPYNKFFQFASRRFLLLPLFYFLHLKIKTKNIITHLVLNYVCLILGTLFLNSGEEGGVVYAIVFSLFALGANILSIILIILRSLFKMKIFRWRFMDKCLKKNKI